PWLIGVSLPWSPLTRPCHGPTTTSSTPACGDRRTTPRRAPEDRGDVTMSSPGIFCVGQLDALVVDRPSNKFSEFTTHPTTHREVTLTKPAAMLLPGAGVVRVSRGCTGRSAAVPDAGRHDGRF